MAKEDLARIPIPAPSEEGTRIAATMPQGAFLARADKGTALALLRSRQYRQWEQWEAGLLMGADGSIEIYLADLGGWVPLAEIVSAVRRQEAKPDEPGA